MGYVGATRPEYASVVKLLSDGLSRREIAKELGVPKSNSDRLGKEDSGAYTQIYGGYHLNSSSDKKTGSTVPASVVCSPFLLVTSYSDLIDIMILDRLDRLSQCPCPPMLMVRMLITVFVKDDARSVTRISCAV